MSSEIPVIRATPPPTVRSNQVVAEPLSEASATFMPPNTSIVTAAIVRINPDDIRHVRFVVDATVLLVAPFVDSLTEN